MSAGHLGRAKWLPKGVETNEKGRDSMGGESRCESMGWSNYKTLFIEGGVSPDTTGDQSRSHGEGGIVIQWIVLLAGERTLFSKT